MKSYSNVVTSYQQSCFQELKTAMAFPRLFQQLINKNSSVDIQGRMLLWAAWKKLLPILPCGVHSVWRKLFPVSSTPSKSASLLTLGNLSQTHMNCLLCLTSFLSVKESGLSPVASWFLSSVGLLLLINFCFASPLHYKQEFPNYFSYNLLKVSCDDDTVRKWKKEDIFVNWSGHPPALKWEKFSSRQSISEANASAIYLEPPLAKGQSVIDSV